MSGPASQLSRPTAFVGAPALPQETPQQPWRQSWLETEEQLRRTTAGLARTAVVSRNARVNKLDADLLDAELTTMLREPVTRAFSLLKPGLTDTYRAELDAAILAVLFWLSVGSAKRRATYGQALQNLRYAETGRGGWRVHVLGAVSIGGGYLWARSVSAMSASGWADAPRQSMRNRLWRLARWLERLAKVAAVANLLAFFAAGQYKSPLERLLGLRLVSARPQLAHSVSFEFLNRQLVWHAFTEFVMFALPLVNAARARSWVVRRARMLLRLPPAKGDPALAALPESVCAVCYQTATSKAETYVEPESCAAVNPYIAKCGHRYCYVCIQTRIMAQAQECTCLRCGEQITAICQFAEH
ncbi:peroxisome assembly protein (Peroxin-2) [Coemansia sp. Benny D115]|nr:peroxisome assembly protein (Peroxin-2) [Coemansia sp. Benny D115]